MAEDVATAAIDVLANDTPGPSNESGQMLAIIAVTDGAHGAVTIIGGGTGLAYTPDLNFHGVDSFTYTVSDGHGGTATAGVSVVVSSVPDAPVANPDTVTAGTGSTLIDTTDLLANDMAVEINTSGLDYRSQAFMPGWDIIEALAASGVPLTLGSDAHSPQQVGRHFDLALQGLKKAGVKELVRFERRQMIAVPIE